MAHERNRLGDIPLVCTHPCQIVNAGGGEDILGIQESFADGKGALIQRAGGKDARAQGVFLRRGAVSAMSFRAAREILSASWASILYMPRAIPRFRGFERTGTEGAEVSNTKVAFLNAEAQRRRGLLSGEAC